MSLFPASAKGRLAAAAAVGAVGLSLTGAGVYAALSAQATNTTAESISSGTLSLRLSAATGSAGFDQAISNLAPGDTVNRYIELDNDGSLAAQGLTLKAADTVNSRLTTDAAAGLQVSVKSCPTLWAAGVCAAPTTLVSTSVSALKATAATLLSGAVPAGVQHLQVSVSLPDASEVTVNGVKPANSIQGLSANLTWTFTEAQRDGATSNS